MAYAEGTTVPVEKSISEIIALIKKAGAQRIAQLDEPGMFALQFFLKERMLRFRIAYPGADDMPARDGHGRPLSPARSRPSDGAASSGVSTVPASIPNADEWDLSDLPLDKRLMFASIIIAQANSTIQEAARSMAWGRDFLARGMKVLNDALLEVEDTALHSRLSAASGIEARRAATPQSGAVHESPAGEAETPDNRQRENPNG